MRGTSPRRSIPRFVAVALALLWGAGALVFAPRGAPAQGGPPSPAPAADTSAAAPRAPLPRIAEVRFEGRARVDSVRIARAFDVRAGQPYDPRAVREGLLRLWATNLFDDLDVRGRTGTDGVHLVLFVAERPRIARISFSGNDKKKEEDLKPHLGFREADAWRQRLLVTGRDSVLTEYAKEGYRDAAVVATADSTAAGMWVQFAITEGRKAQVTSIAFEGARAFGPDDLDGVLKSKKKGFPFKSGTVKEENLAEDLERLRTFYRERGYRDVEVERLPFLPDPK
ncbi:MAG: POTRA domain-containing protein, partial [Candidatus Eisenbacteria bacterium]